MAFQGSFQAERATEQDTFRCRKCRVFLFNGRSLAAFHKKTEAVDQCSSWYLDADQDCMRDTLPWIHVIIVKAQWTEGKIYCPKCKSRIGAFNFIHGVRCSCFTYVIPAVWIQKCKVDQTSLQDINRINIRYAMTDSDTLKNTAAAESLTGAYGTSLACNVDSTGILDNINEVPGKNKKLNQGNKTLSWAGNSSKETQYAGYGHNRYILEQEIICNGQEVVLSHEEQTYHIKQTLLDTQDHESMAQCTVSGSYRVSPVVLKCSSRLEALHKHQHELRKRRLENTFEDTSHDKVLNVRIGHLSGVSRYHVLENDVQEMQVHEVEPEIESDQVELPDHLSCPVCLDLLFDPFSCGCGHMFCDPCLRLLNNKSPRKVLRCPLCRKPVNYIFPAEVTRAEVRKTFPHEYRKRWKMEVRSPHRLLPLPDGKPRPKKKKVSCYSDLHLPYFMIAMVALVFVCCVLCIVFLISACPPGSKGCIQGELFFD
ncbi:uncharacterized protein LOC5510593 [Nematostella vectensis]|uniref:uncharacterized protein LOC5510593 n=1 Tax=Nematostella vectensis TaxID=45351 RepID=UPI0020778B8A|nr:uncharacterized protein LOC5510593 [Nematostella vectensis]